MASTFAAFCSSAPSSQSLAFHAIADVFNRIGPVLTLTSELHRAEYNRAMQSLYRRVGLNIPFERLFVLENGDDDDDNDNTPSLVVSGMSHKRRRISRLPPPPPPPLQLRPNDRLLTRRHGTSTQTGLDTNGGDSRRTRNSRNAGRTTTTTCDNGIDILSTLYPEILQTIIRFALYDDGDNCYDHRRHGEALDCLTLLTLPRVSRLFAYHCTLIDSTRILHEYLTTTRVITRLLQSILVARRLDLLSPAAHAIAHSPTWLYRNARLTGNSFGMALWLLVETNLSQTSLTRAARLNLILLLHVCLLFPLARDPHFNGRDVFDNSVCVLPYIDAWQATLDEPMYRDGRARHIRAQLHTYVAGPADKSYGWDSGILLLAVATKLLDADKINYSSITLSAVVFVDTTALDAEEEEEEDGDDNDNLIKARQLRHEIIDRVCLHHRRDDDNNDDNTYISARHCFLVGHRRRPNVRVYHENRMYMARRHRISLQYASCDDFYQLYAHETVDVAENHIREFVESHVTNNAASIGNTIAMMPALAKLRGGSWERAREFVRDCYRTCYFRSYTRQEHPPLAVPRSPLANNYGRDDNDINNNNNDDDNDENDLFESILMSWYSCVLANSYSGDWESCPFLDELTWPFLMTMHYFELESFARIYDRQMHRLANVDTGPIATSAASGGGGRGRSGRLTEHEWIISYYGAAFDADIARLRSFQEMMLVTIKNNNNNNNNNVDARHFEHSDASSSSSSLVPFDSSVSNFFPVVITDLLINGIWPRGNSELLVNGIKLSDVWEWGRLDNENELQPSWRISCTIIQCVASITHCQPRRFSSTVMDFLACVDRVIIATAATTIGLDEPVIVGTVDAARNHALAGPISFFHGDT